MNCLEIIEKAYLEQGLPENSIPTMLASVTKSEINKYEKYLQQWYKFCMEKNGQKLTRVSRNDIITFFGLISPTFVNDNDLNDCKSALSLILREELMDNDYLKIYFKGLLNLKKTNKEEETKNSNRIAKSKKVLKLISIMSLNKNKLAYQDFGKVSKYFLTTMRILSNLCFESLAMLKWKNMKIDDEFKKFKIENDNDCNCSDCKSSTLDFSFKSKNIYEMCLKNLHDVYKIKTKNLTSLEPGFLFMTLVKPHRSCSATNLKRWFIETVEESKASLTDENNLNRASTSASTYSGFTQTQNQKFR